MPLPKPQLAKQAPVAHASKLKEKMYGYNPNLVFTAFTPFKIHNKGNQQIVRMQLQILAL